MSKKKLFASVVALSSLAIMGSFASAGVVPFGSITASGTEGTGDSAALTTNGIKSTADASDDWNFQSYRDNDGTVTVTFNLGASYTLSQLDVSTITNTGAGVSKPSTVNLWFSSTPTFNVAPDQVFNAGADANWTETVPWTVNVDQPLPVSATAQYVKAQFQNSTGWVGITEVQFDTPSAVPEPASMGLLGLGALALIRRRRHRVA